VFLYILIDSPWDTTNSTLYWHENVWLAFDTAHDNGWAPQWDDYLVHATTSWTSNGWAGNGTAWNQTWLGWAGIVSAAQGGENFGLATPLLPSPNSATPHRVSEMAVPLTLVGSAGSTVGFYAQVDDDSTDPDGPDPPGWLPATAYSEWPPLSGGSPGWPGPWGPPSAPCAAPSAWGDLILSVPVGGTVLTVDKLSLLAPYIALVSMIAVAGAAAIYFIRRKKLR